MGLEGYLEDLGICDILQIVSLSKKSGTLSLSGKTAEGVISFLEGQVVRAVSSQFPENLGTLLCRAGLTTRQQIIDALKFQKGAKQHRPLGELLTELHGISPEDIEAEVTRRIETIVLSFLAWSGGTFVFQLEEPERFGSAQLNPLDLMLEKGIAPQLFLAKGQQLVADPDLVGGLPGDAGAKALEKKLGEEDLGRLRGMLAELENPSMSGGIILLILRYASEVLRRAIIFDVRGRQLIGLGQFGLDSLPGAADMIVRKMRLNAEADSIFGQALQQQAAIRGVLGDLPDERFVCEILGGQADEVFVGPLVSGGKVVAVLYGDNYPHQGPILSANAFEVFLAQAGIEMEQMLRDGTNHG